MCIYTNKQRNESINVDLEILPFLMLLYVRMEMMMHVLINIVCKSTLFEQGYMVMTLGNIFKHKQ